MSVHTSGRPVVFISAISSDIGTALAERYSRDGYVVAGTYRSEHFLDKLRHLPDCHLFYCDLTNLATINESTGRFADLGLEWKTFISCASWPPPLSGFFDCDFERWSRSVHVNAIEQLRVLHSLYSLRRRDLVANVVFFAGPGTNNAVKHFSALTLSKISLIKMCELLHAENADLNAFIVGPGWTKTKTHEFILADPDVSPEKCRETLEFMRSNRGTTMDDIYACIRWLCREGREVAGGRNFSVVHDLWGEDELAIKLREEDDMYKLRRHRNDWQDRVECER